jgi:hypothetical protein
MERRAAHLFESGIYRKGEVGTGVDQRAVEIENEDANIREGRRI